AKFRFVIPAALAFASTPAIVAAQDGAALYESACAACHAMPVTDAVPSLEKLRSLDANTILEALTSGKMSLQGQALRAEQRVAVSEYLAGAPVAARVARFEQGQCEAEP